MMTRARACITAAALLLTSGCAAMSGGGPNQAAPGGQSADTNMSLLRARAGDTVYFVQHYVRPERRQQFEDFVLAVLWPALDKAAAAQPARRALRSVRLLQPTAPSGDALVYTFVLDPYLPGESYSVFELLKGVYPEEEALKQYSRFTETWARDFTTHAFVQFREPARQ